MHIVEECEVPNRNLTKLNLTYIMSDFITSRIALRRTYAGSLGLIKLDIVELFYVLLKSWLPKLGNEK